MATKIKKITEVLRYIEAIGFRISRTAFYNHKDRGLITPDAEGRYSLGVIEKYARDHLSRKEERSGGRPTNEDIASQSEEQKGFQEKEQEEKLALLKAKRERAEMQLAIERKELIKRIDVASMFAGRAGILRSDLEAFIRRLVPETINVADGDQGKTQELLEFCFDELEEVLDRYAKPLDKKVVGGE